MHAAIEPYAALIGTWQGEAKGYYPTIKDFAYRDEWVITDMGSKPFLTFTERTWNAAGVLMHVEVFYLRFPAPGRCEIVGAIPTGQSEIGSGTVEITANGVTISTQAGVTNTETAKQVEAIERDFILTGDTLTYVMRMAAVDQPLTEHLRVELSRA